VRLSGLPANAPDAPVTTIALECDAEPRQDQLVVRKERERKEA
jgi:alpha-L-fucosidase